MSGNPTKVDGLDINECLDGYVIYDQRRDRVHFLNYTAVMVLQLCNGEFSPDEIADMMRRAYALDEVPTDLVLSALKQLHEEGLIQSA